MVSWYRVPIEIFLVLRIIESTTASGLVVKRIFEEKGKKQIIIIICTRVLYLHRVCIQIYTYIYICIYYVS